MKVKLLSYDLPRGSEMPIDPKYTTIIAETLQDDSLQFVDYWSVDFDYDGHIFKPDKCLYKEKDSVETECIKLGSSVGRIAVRVIDIFGNSSFKVI